MNVDIASWILLVAAAVAEATINRPPARPNEPADALKRVAAGPRRKARLSPRHGSIELCPANNLFGGT